MKNKHHITRSNVWFARLARAAVVGVAVVLAAYQSVAAESESYRGVGGLSVYLGVVPSEIASDHHRSRAERTMHGGAPSEAHSYHVLVAVFDQATGERLKDLTVRASVHAHGQATSAKPLEPMTVGEALTYGNYFSIPGSGEHQISVEILRPGATQPVRADFTHVVPPR